VRADPKRRSMTARAPTTVMEVTPNLEVGGAQETVRTLAKYLPRYGHPVVVCTFADGPLRADIERLGVPVEILPSRRHSVTALPLFLVEVLRLRRALCEVVRRHHVDVVQTQGLGTLDFLVMTLRWHHRVQVWWTIQNASFLVRAENLPAHPWLLGAKRRSHRMLYRVGARLVNGVITVSEATAESFRSEIGTTAGRVTVVFNAVDTERYPAAVERARVRDEIGVAPVEHMMTMVGTFKRQKGHAELIRAVAAVADRFPHLKVVLIGDGELLPAIRDQALAAGIGSRVVFLGTRRDVPEILAASDSFVLPSLWEGLSVALVEAMASGLPVIATGVSGTDQVMIDGVTGWLVAPADAAALATAISDVLSDPARAERMATAARARARSFSALGQAEHLASLFAGAA
jgi:glycosyltransferase involved in cell wall biosynthesis